MILHLTDEESKPLVQDTDIVKGQSWDMSPCRPTLGNRFSINVHLDLREICFKAIVRE